MLKVTRIDKNGNRTERRLSWYVKRRRGELTFMPVEAMIEYGRGGWLGRIYYLSRKSAGQILRILTGERAMKWCRGR